MLNKIAVYFRFLRRRVFVLIRQAIGLFFGLYLRRINGLEHLPSKGPCLIVSNHLSYLDSLIVSSIYRKRYIVILASNEIKKQPLMHWLSKLNVTIFVDTERNSTTYLKELIRLLKRDHIVLLYPEGTRSRQGKMNEPRSGFVKIAHSLGVPLLPWGVKGSFEILPPHRIFPRFRRCEVFLGKPVKINRDNFDARFFDEKNNLTKQGIDVIGYQIMNGIALMVNQDWDDAACSKIKLLGVDFEGNNCHI